MDGNMSTGMRARLVTPTTAMTRQMTTMKYGLRMAKPDILRYLTAYYIVSAVIAVTFGRTSWPGCRPPAR